jgi:hypothetical protein
LHEYGFVQRTAGTAPLEVFSGWRKGPNARQNQFVGCQDLLRLIAYQGRGANPSQHGQH